MTSEATASPTGIARAVLVVFLPFAGGYFLSYLYRSINAVIAEKLVVEIGLTAADLGLLTSVYFLSFALFQLPLGMLLDRFGPRRVQATLLCVAASGALLFSLGESRAVLIAGRALIGLGVAGGLMASFKAITLWFPKDRWPLVNGCFMAMGGLGAMAATLPVQLALGYTDWRGVFAALAAATVVVAAIIFTVVPERRDVAAPTGESLFAGVRMVFTHPLFWSVAPLAIACLGTQLAVLTLWAGPWLADVGGFSREAVATRLLALNAAMTAGFVFNGLAADFLQRRGVSVAGTLIAGTAVLLVAQSTIVFEVDPTALWPWLLYGLFSNWAILVYPQLSGRFPLAYAGRVNTCLNFLLFGGSFAIQYAIGWIIDLWPRPGEGAFAPEAYGPALGTFLALQVAALLLYAWSSRRLGR